MPVVSTAMFVENGHDEHFLADNGAVVPVSGLHRRLQIVVLSIVPRDHHHEEEPSCTARFTIESGLVHA